MQGAKACKGDAEIPPVKGNRRHRVVETSH